MELYDIQKALQIARDPVRLALAVTKNEQEKYDATTLEWFMRTSYKPPMLAISVGHTRYAHHCLNNFRYFNLCLADPSQKEAVKLCGSISGRDNDKFAICNFDYFLGKLSKLPIIRGAIANFECEVISQINSGDHTIFTGEIKYAWVDESARTMTWDDLLK